MTSPAKLPLKTQRAFIERFLQKDASIQSAAKAVGITLTQAKAICRNPPRPESYRERIRREMLATPKYTRQAFLDRVKGGEPIGTAAEAVGFTIDVALATILAARKTVQVMTWDVK